MEQEELDEILGISRCVRCGHRLDGEVECPVCTGYYDKAKHRHGLPRWIYFTACMLTSPLSIPFIVSSKRLSFIEKVLAVSGAVVWVGVIYKVFV